MSCSIRAAEGGFGSARELQRGPAIGKLQAVLGVVTVTRADGTVAQSVAGNPVYQGDLVETGNDSLVAIVFVDGTTFRLNADACLALDKFTFDEKASSNSAVLRVLRGMFTFFAGKVANTGQLSIETPFGQIRGAAPAAGIGSVALGVFTLALLEELRAQSADVAFLDKALDVAFLDNGTIAYKDLKHGVLEFHYIGDPARGIPPQDLVISDPGTTFIFRPPGSGGVEEVTNTSTQMAQLQNAYLSTYSNYLEGLQDPFFQQWQHAYVQPQSTGAGGSSTPPSLLEENPNNGNNNNQQQANNGNTPHNTASDSGTNTGVTFDVLPPPPPPPPTVAPVATTGVEGPPISGGPVSGGEGSPIPLDLGVTPSAGSSLASVVVSAIPLGAVLSDGTSGHSFTATPGNTSVDVVSWTIASLTITAPNDHNFTLTVTATDESVTGVSAPASGTELVTVNPLAPTVAPVAESGPADVEGSPITLDLGIAVNSESGTYGDPPGTNSLYSVTISDIPSGATLSNSNGNALTIAGGSITFDAAELKAGVLNGLAITPSNDTNFTLQIAATEVDAEGNLSATTNGSELVTVNPLAPTVAPVAESGVEGTKIALNLGVTVNSESGTYGDPPGTNTLQSLVISSIPVGALLSDGQGDFFLALPGHTSVNVTNWNLSSLTIIPPNDTNFTLQIAATEVDAEGNLSKTTNGSELVTVNPLAPIVLPESVSGVEGQPIALHPVILPAGLLGDSNTIDSVTISDIPSGATLSDSNGTLTVAGGSITFDAAELAAGVLNGLAITPSNDTNFTLQIAATEVDAEGNLSKTTNGSELVTVNPLAPTVAPVAESGVEGTKIALNLGVTVNSESGTYGDPPGTNSLYSVKISDIPSGATLSDSNGTLTVAGGSITFDAAELKAGVLNGLAITPSNDTNFTLQIAATEVDAEGNLSKTTNGSELVTVNPLAPTVAPVAESGPADVEGSPIALDLGIAVNSESGTHGDPPGTNSLYSVTISDIPSGATLSDSNGTLTVAGGSITFDAAELKAGVLNGLAITPSNDTNFTLQIAATEVDAEGNLSKTTNGSELVTVNPLAPTVAPVAESGPADVEGSPITLDLGIAVNSESGTYGDPPGTNSLYSVTISDIPSGATLSNSNGNALTIAGGSITFDAAELKAGVLNGLAITPSNDTNFTLQIAATEVDAEGNLSATTNGSELVTVNPLAPTVAPVAESGVEGTKIALNLGVTVNSESGTYGDPPGTNSLYSVTISDIPSGATLSDSNGTLTVAGGSITFDAAELAAGVLNGLAITPSNDTNFTLQIAATEVDAEGNLSKTTNGSELVTVNPLAPTVAPVAESGVEGTKIALNLGVTVNSESGTYGDPPGTNSLYSVKISDIPSGATLSDSNGTLTVAGGSITFDAAELKAGVLNGLAITPSNDTNFTLQIAATEVDAEGNLSTTTSGSELVTVNPLAPTVAPVAESGVEGTKIALNLGVTVNSESGTHGDAPGTNSLYSVKISDIPSGATLSDSFGTLTVTGGSGSITFDAAELAAGVLNSLTITPSNDTNFTLQIAATEVDAEGNLSKTTNGSELVTVNPPAPAGVGGSPINLALANPSAAAGKTVAITVTGMPSDWQLNQGTNVGNGTWTLQTGDLNTLTVMTAAVYAGAMLLNVTETWTNADGSTGMATIADNVEAYGPGSPIFAWSGADTLTGTGGNDLFVFAQPIGNDTIYDFNVASDQIDLVGFTGIAGFGDIAGAIAGDNKGDTVITLGAGETITLQTVDPASLTAADFVFNQTPTVDNTATMTVSDGALLPLGGIIDNTGTIALNSTGDATELQIIGDGVTLEGGGRVILSDSAENMIVGTNVGATLTNLDNTISGAGQIGAGDGNLTLVNETAGTIDANYADGTLTLDTGNTIVNAGLLEATSGGTLQIDDNLSNSGTLAANGGTLIVAGDVSGAGNVVIGDGGLAAFTGAFNQNVAFAGSGTLELDHSQSYTGAVSGFGAGDAIDLNDLAYSANDTLIWTQDSSVGILTIDDNGTTENITIDGNYTQGEFALTNDGTPADGTDVVSVPVDVAAATTLDLTGPSSETVEFTAATGSLVLNDPDGFSGQIIGFNGTAPDAAHSDTVDLVGINYNSSGFAEIVQCFDRSARGYRRHQQREHHVQRFQRLTRFCL